jgi:two-component system, NtrC family, response regulator GlrR
LATPEKNKDELENRLVGRSRSHLELVAKLTAVAPTDAEVLIVGPTGVGKELYAQHVHVHSHRRARRFIPVNCGALSADLLENTLFGHVGGAFTGARSQSEGLVSEAEGGTLFLDEVDSLSLPCQIKLLRFLQDKRYRRLGENHLRQADVRVIAATNSDLEAGVGEGRFRGDLFFRLRVVPVEVPALKQRPEDIQALIEVFSEKYACSYHLPPVKFTPGALQCMHNYEWPGNVRELENCVAYLTCLQLARPAEARDLPLLSRWRERRDDEETSPNPEFESLRASKSRLVAQFERQYITQALKSTSGNVTAAARMSGKNRRALFELMRKHEISADEFRRHRS